MKELIVTTVLLMCSMSVLAETSICSGSWENGQPVRVAIDWDKNIVKVNGVITEITNATSDGVYTSRHKNKFGHFIRFAVMNLSYNVHTPSGIFLYKSSNRATFVIQIDLDTQTNNASKALHCSKSFTKPLMARIL